MNEDRIWEMYYSDVYQSETHRACRDRIHWLAARVQGRVLDVGCSQGVLPILLGREGREVVGVEIEEPAVEFARARLAEEPEHVQARVEFLLADMFTWEAPGTFDSVVLGEVLEHLVNPAEMLGRCREVMNPGARLLVSVPLGWLEHHDHKQAFVPSDLVRMLDDGFGIQELDVIHGKICVMALIGGETDKDVVRPERLLAMVEDALRDAQYGAADAAKTGAAQRDRLQARLKDFERQKEALERNSEALKKQAERAQERVRTAGEKARILHERNQKLSARIEELTAARKKLRESGSYELGSLLVGVGLRPASALRLPDRLASLALRAARQRFAGELPAVARVGPLKRAKKATSREVYEGSFRVVLPNAAPIAEPGPKRVLHLLEYSLPYQQNGYTLRSFNIVRSQKELGWEPVVVTKPGFPEEGSANGEPEEVAGVPHYRLPGQALNGQRIDLATYTRVYVEEAARVVETIRPFLVQAGSNFRNAYAAMELARNYRLPFVYEVRGLWEETRVANGRLERYDKMYEQLVGVETSCMKSADAVITLGESLRDEIARRGVPAEKIFLVPNAVDPATVELRAPRPDLREALGLRHSFVVSYIGSVSRLERLDVLIDAMELLRRRRRNVAALIVGDGAELENLRKQAAALGLEESVKFAGRVPHGEISDYYAITDAVVCARGTERVCELVTPLKPYEAMVYRKPVVVSGIPALREMVQDRKTGRIFRAEDPAALADVLEDLAGDPDACRALAESGYEWVCEHRTWRRVSENYASAYTYALSAFHERNRG